MCSCGALAETLGDTHRHKMPHGPKWNRLNMLGQVILAVALFSSFASMGGSCLIRGRRAPSIRSCPVVQASWVL